MRPPHQFTSPGATVTAARPHPLHPSNKALVAINWGTLLLSIPILIVGLWLAARHHADCLSFLQWPLIFIGLVTLLVSVIGLLGALRSRALLLWVYLCLLSLLILLLFAFTIFAFVVTTGSKGHMVAGTRFKEYLLGDYSHWMRERVGNPQRWEQIKQCLRKDGTCDNMDSKYPTSTIMCQSKLSYIESGCCKPPSACLFRFVTATTWVNATNAAATPDCQRWNNSPRQRCYDCDACKAAVIRSVKKDWRKAAVASIVLLVLLALLYVLAWLAFLQALAHKTLHPSRDRHRLNIDTRPPPINTAY